MPWWKSRKWLLHLTYRMFSHFSKPSSVRRKAAQEFAVMWMVSEGGRVCFRHATHYYA
jgi:hypothetical protein